MKEKNNIFEIKIDYESKKDIEMADICCIVFFLISEKELLYVEKAF